MTQKNDTSNSELSRTICDLKSALGSNPKSPLHKVSFKSYGRRFVITNKDQDVVSKIEKTFNQFLKTLKVNTGDKKIKGLCFLDKKSDAFKLAYIKEGEPILRQIVRKKV